MRKLSLIVLSLFVTVAMMMSVSCTRMPGEPQDTPLESQTIGSEGGTLAVDGFSLTVVPDSFTSDVELKVFASSEDSPFGDRCISKTFRLEGIPDEYDKSLQVRIKYEGTLSEESFIAVGEEVFVSSLNTLKTAYTLFAATETSGYLVCELPAPEGEKSRGNYMAKVTNGAGHPLSLPRIAGYTTYATNMGHLARASYKGNYTAQATNRSGYSLSILAITGYATYTSDAGHFTILFPVYLAEGSGVEKLARYLEEAYTTFENMGFSYAARTKWPVSVTMKDLGPEAYGYFECSIWGDNDGYMGFNANKVNELVEMRVSAGHEFFHLVQSLYDPRDRYSKKKFAPLHHWLNEASAVWSEEKFSDKKKYVSSIRKGHELAPFNGMQAGAEQNAGYHGYGMSAMVKYLVDQYGESILVSMYEKIRDGAHPVEAVNTSAADPIFLWWERFFREYITGKIYGVESAYFIGNRSGLFRIQLDTDTSATFRAGYSDLSAKLYMIRLDYPDIDGNAAIEFEVSGELCEVTVFKYKKGSAIEYLDTAPDSLTISNVKGLTDGGCHLLALVTNSRDRSPYTGTSDIDLEIEVTIRRGEVIVWAEADCARLCPPGFKPHPDQTKIHIGDYRSQLTCDFCCPEERLHHSAIVIISAYSPSVDEVKEGWQKSAISNAEKLVKSWNERLVKWHEHSGLECNIQATCEVMPDRVTVHVPAATEIFFPTRECINTIFNYKNAAIIWVEGELPLADLVEDLAKKLVDEKLAEMSRK